MKINLRQADIEQALKMYLTSQGIVLQDRTFEVTFRAGRKGSGLSADVNIGTAEVKLLSEPEEAPAVAEAKPVEATVTPAPVFTPEAETPIAAPVVLTPTYVAPAIEVPTVTPPNPLSMFSDTVPSLEPEPTPVPVKAPSLFA